MSKRGLSPGAMFLCGVGALILLFVVVGGFTALMMIVSEALQQLIEYMIRGD